MTAPPDDAPEATSPLAGLRVLDLSRVLAGPFCAQLLGDHGADVIKVEGPRGDDTRAWGPPFLPDGVSAYYTGLNRSKRNICVDLSRPDGRAVVRDLISTADVVIENFRPGTMARWGMSYGELAQEFPRLIYCCVSGYGADGTGPWGARPGYDAVLQAAGGLMSVNGSVDEPPLRVGVPIVDIATAFVALSGILMALTQRARTGEGQLVDATLFDTVTALLHPHSASWLADGRTPVRTGAAHPTVVPYQTFATATGPLFIGAGNDGQFARLCAALGMPELAHAPEYASNSARVAHRDELIGLIEDRLAAEEIEAIARRLVAAEVPCSPIYDVGAALCSPHAHHRGTVISDGDYRGVASPIRLSGSPATAAVKPARPGEHSDEILAELGRTPAQIGELVASATVQRANTALDDR
jgi:crotonobetainyl-CoA:carnitine CoA-transferase CaiB-like acyl-CoA transferase